MSGWYLRGAAYPRERYWRMVRDGRCTICGGDSSERVLCEACALKRKVRLATKEA